MSEHGYSQTADNECTYGFGPSLINFYCAELGGRRHRTLAMKIGKTRLNIYLSPTGRSVRVYKDNKELT